MRTVLIGIVGVLVVTSLAGAAHLTPPVPDPALYVGAVVGRCIATPEVLLVRYYWVSPDDEDEDMFVAYHRVAQAAERHPFALLDTRTPFVWVDADRDGHADWGYPVEAGYWTPVAGGPCALLDYLLARSR